MSIAVKQTAQPKARPIIFGAESVRAILDNSKTQTRRVVKWRPLVEGLNLSASSLSLGHYCTGVPESGYVLYSRDGRGVWHQRTEREHCRYGKVGDRLWVREKWMYVGPGSGSDLPTYVEERALPENHKREHCWYYADPSDEDKGIYAWQTPIYMPRWAARINLEITGVRVERLNEINEADVKAEGICVDSQRLAAFAVGWNSLNAKRGYSWEANPWVWVISFRRLS